MAIDQRRLAAIVLADVVGYSRLMGADERGTLASLRSLRHEVIDPKLVEHGGRLVKTMGDGFLVEFGSAVNAVRCAVEVQQAIAERAGGLADDRILRLRIGINVGDILIDGDDIFGDDVNIAARLQTLAEPGGICVSKVVADQLRGRLDIRLEALGAQQVKNIAQPVEAYRVLPHASAAPAPVSASTRALRLVAKGRKLLWIAVGLASLAIAAVTLTMQLDLYAPSRGVGPPALSVAVLPFVASGDDAATRHAADAVSRFMRAGLPKDSAMGPNLRVVSYDERGAGARYRVEGNVARDSARIVLDVRVVDAMAGDQLWGHRESLHESDLAAGFPPALLQLKRNLVSTVKRAERKRVIGLPVAKLTSPELLLRAEAAWTDNSLVSLREAKRFVDEALRVDPRYARAWGMKGMLVNLEGDVDPHQDRERIGREQAEFTARAVTLDPMDASLWSHHSNALVYLSRWDAALEAVNEAARLDPDEAMGYRLLRAWIRGLMGRPDEALAIIDEVSRVDPTLNASAARNACEAYVLAGRAVEAATTCEKSVLLFDDWISKVYLLAAYGNSGQKAKAEALKAEILRDVPTYSIAQLRAKRYSDHPDYLVLAERNWYSGLRKAGIPEQ